MIKGYATPNVVGVQMSPDVQQLGDSIARPVMTLPAPDKRLVQHIQTCPCPKIQYSLGVRRASVRNLAGISKSILAKQCMVRLSVR